MTLESEFRKLIDDTIGGKYIGKLAIEQEPQEDGKSVWTMFMYLNLEYSPLIMSYQGTKEQFKDFIKKEIKSRKLERVSYWKTTKEPTEYE